MATASAVTNSFSSPGVLVSENFADLLNVQFKKIAQSMWEAPMMGLKYFREENSNRAYEKFSHTVDATPVPKSRDIAAMPLLEIRQGFDTTITPEVFRAAILVEERLRETDQFGVINKLMTYLNRATRDTIELYAARPFNTGFSATVDWVCGDGMNLFDKARPYADPAAGTWANEETAGVLSAAAIDTMRQSFQTNKGHNGQLRPLTMKTIIIPPALEATAIREMQAAQYPGGNLNDANPITKYQLGYEVWPYLTSSTYWFGSTAIDSEYELIWLWGKRPTFSDYNPNDGDTWGKKVRMVFATGCETPPQHLRGNQGA